MDLRNAAAATPSGRNIIVAVDDDQESWEAVKFTLKDLYQAGDVLHLLHVIPKDSCAVPTPPSHAASSYNVTSSLDFEAFLHDSSVRFIRETMLELADQRNARCEVDIVRGRCRQSVGEAICKVADELEASLVVVPGRRRPHLVERIFNGECALQYGSFVAKHSNRPTVIFKMAEVALA